MLSLYKEKKDGVFDESVKYYGSDFLLHKDFPEFLTEFAKSLLSSGTLAIVTLPGALIDDILSIRFSYKGIAFNDATNILICQLNRFTLLTADPRLGEVAKMEGVKVKLPYYWKLQRNGFITSSSVLFQVFCIIPCALCTISNHCSCMEFPLETELPLWDI